MARRAWSARGLVARRARPRLRGSATSSGAGDHRSGPASGVVELGVDRAQDEARGFGALAAELLALVLLERRAEIGQEEQQLRRPLEVAGVERGHEACDGGAGVVDGVAPGV